MNRLSLVMFFFPFLCASLHASESTDVTSNLNKLPKLSIDSYKNELLEIQKLQRDNEKLKLEEQKISIRDKLKKLERDDIRATKIISIYSSASRRYAQLYNPYDGVKTVSIGSILMNKYQVVEIASTYLILEDVRNRNDKIQVELATPGTTD